METRNAKIRGAEIFVEDHGILTACIYLEYGVGVQGFGGYPFGGAKDPIESTFGIEFIRRVLDIVGVDKWSKLAGCPVRAEADRGKVHRIGHFLEDRWFDPSELAKELND